MWLGGVGSNPRRRKCRTRDLWTIVNRKSAFRLQRPKINSNDMHDMINIKYWGVPWVSMEIYPWLQPNQRFQFQIAL